MAFKFNQIVRVAIIALPFIFMLKGCPPTARVESAEQLKIQIIVAKGKQDYERVVSALKKLIQRDDDPQYKTELGQMYLSGDKIAKNEEEGVYWLQQAANQDDAEAEFLMSEIYYVGAGGVKSDALLAMKWLKKAAAQNHPKAFYNLSIAAHNGKYLTQNDQSAFEMMSRSAELGFPAAKGALGVMYLEGIGTEKDVNQGLKWLQTAAAENDPQSQVLLAYLYENGALLPKNIDAAIDWYRKAIAQNHPEAMFRLALLDGIGKGTPLSADESIKLLTQAAELNHASSIDALIWVYTESPDLKYRSVEKAQYWQTKRQQQSNKPKNADDSIRIDLASILNNPTVKGSP